MIELMDLEEREKYAQEQLAFVVKKYRHMIKDPDSWRIEIGRTRNLCAGVCSYRKKLITISDRLIGKVDFIDVLWHELAHMCAAGDKHGLKWRKMAVELGAIPRATSDIPEEAFIVKPRPDPKWLIVYKKKEGALEVVKSARRRIKNIHAFSLKGKEGSLGRLFFIEKKVYEKCANDCERMKFLTR